MDNVSQHRFWRGQLSVPCDLADRIRKGKRRSKSLLRHWRMWHGRMRRMGNSALGDALGWQGQPGTGVGTARRTLSSSKGCSHQIMRHSGEQLFRRRALREDYAVIISSAIEFQCPGGVEVPAPSAHSKIEDSSSRPAWLANVLTASRASLNAGLPTGGGTKSEKSGTDSKPSSRTSLHMGSTGSFSGAPRQPLCRRRGAN